MSAMEAEDILRSLGFQAIELASTADAALDILSRSGGDIAFPLLRVRGMLQRPVRMAEAEHDG